MREYSWATTSAKDRYVGLTAHDSNEITARQWAWSSVAATWLQTLEEQFHGVRFSKSFMREGCMQADLWYAFH